MIGLVPPGPSGVRDYGHLLAEALAGRGLRTHELWLENDGVDARRSIESSLALLRSGWAVRRGTVLVWHYSPFAYAFRGIPLGGVFLGLLMRARGIPVVTVLHELAYPWHRRGARGMTLAFTHRAVLPAVLIGSNAVVVTTAQRRRWVREIGWLSSRRPVHMMPVFSTIRDCASRTPHEGVPRVGVIGYGSDGVRVDLLFAAIVKLRLATSVVVVLLGAPGAESREGQRWMEAAAAAGLPGVLQFTGVVSSADLSAHLRSCDVVTLLDEEGPSSRRTMLAAALAHGCAVVSTDGPNRWDEAVRQGAVAVVPPNADDLATVLERLLVHPEEREVMSVRGREFYDREMSLDRATDAWSQLLATLQR